MPGRIIILLKQEEHVKGNYSFAEISRFVALGRPSLVTFSCLVYLINIGTVLSCHFCKISLMKVVII